MTWHRRRRACRTARERTCQAYDCRSPAVSVRPGRLPLHRETRGVVLYGANQVGRQAVCVLGYLTESANLLCGSRLSNQTQQRVSSSRRERARPLPSASAASCAAETGSARATWSCPSALASLAHVLARCRSEEPAEPGVNFRLRLCFTACRISSSKGLEVGSKQMAQSMQAWQWADQVLPYSGLCVFS